MTERETGGPRQSRSERGHHLVRADPRNDTSPQYASTQPLEADSEPVLTFEIRLVSGEEGRALRMAQAEAIKEILLWLRSKRVRSAAPRADGITGNE